MAGNTVTIRANVDLRGSLKFGKDFNELPPTGEVGQVIMHRGVLYAYESLGGVELWYPLTQASRAYVHNQGVPALEWTVTHDLDSTLVWFSVQDENGHPEFPQKETIDANSFKLIFTEPTAGYCVCVAPGDMIVPRVQVETLNAASLSCDSLIVAYSKFGTFSVGQDGPLLNGASLVSTTTLTGYMNAHLTAGKYVQLIEGDKLPSNIMPPLAIGETFVVDSLEGMYSVDAQQGDVCVVTTGVNKGSYILAGSSPSIDTNWVLLASPSDVATSLVSPVQINVDGDASGSVSFAQGGSYSLNLKLLGDTVQSVTANGPTAINFANGYYAAVNVTGACTLSFSGIPADGKAYGVTLEFTNGGTNVTFPGSVTWLDKAPTLKAAGKSMVTLVTRDGGASWLGQ